MKMLVLYTMPVYEKETANNMSLILHQLHSDRPKCLISGKLKLKEIVLYRVSIKQLLNFNTNQ